MINIKVYYLENKLLKTFKNFTFIEINYFPLELFILNELREYFLLQLHDDKQLVKNLQVKLIEYFYKPPHMKLI